MTERRQRGFWVRVGGRKMFNSYLAYASLTVMAMVLHASFGEYAIGVLAALGISTASVAYEDKSKRDASIDPEPGDDPPQEQG